MKLQANTLVSFGGALLTLASLATAQHEEHQDATHPQSVILRSFGMDRADGLVRAGGPSYKAWFDASGMTYTPALGKQASRNYPWHFALRTVRRGDTVLFDAANAAAAEPVLAGQTARYDRAGVIERYTARVDGLKQDFVFAHPPAGHGDLIVEGIVTTEMVARPRPDGTRGLGFDAEAVGGVNVGAVVGVDSRGHRVPGEMVFEGDVLRFVLPGDFVARASYPLVLDPLVSTSLTVMASAASDPDVAFDETVDTYLVVWEQVFSALDIDIRGQRFDLAGGLISGLLNITFESGNEINPAVANSNLANRFFVAFQDGASPFGPWNIRGRNVPSGVGGPLTPIFDITTPGGVDEITPDVGGDGTFLSVGVIVVWADGNGNIVATHVDTTSDAVALPTVLRFGGSANPAISKTGGADGRYVVAWERDYTIDWDVETALVDRNMTVLDSFAGAGSVIGTDELRPDVDGDGTNFVVVYQRDEELNPNRFDVFCRRMIWNGATLSATGAPRRVSFTADIDDTEPAVGLLGLKYLVAWVHGTGFATDVRTIELDPTDCTACGALESSAGGPNLVDFGPEISTRYHGHPANDPVVRDQGFIVWTDLALPPAGIDSAVVGHLYEAFGGGVVTNLGGACGNGGINGFNGPVALGNSELELTLTASPSSTLHVSIQFADVTIPCGPCEINALASYYPATAGPSGSASFPLSIPCDQSLQGVSLFTQWVSVFSGQSPCGLIPPSAGLSFSNRLRVDIQP